jgi:hypothetical protein
MKRVLSSDNPYWRSFEMWIAMAIGWIIGCASLYFYLYATAAPAPDDKCFDCHLTDCSDCPEEIQVVEKKAA